MQKKLSFNSLNEFQQYIAENNIQLSDLEIFQNEDDKQIIPEEVNVSLVSLHDNPVVKAKVGENNILYVNELNINENTCMPSMINVLGRKLSVVLCNYEGKTHTKLNIALENKTLYNVEFELKKMEENNFIMEVTKETIENKNE